MSAVLKVFLSMSCSGGLLILVLLLGKCFWKDKVSRQWQYYIWLVVILRLLLPFGPEITLLGRTYQAVEQAITQAAPLPQTEIPGDGPAPGFAPVREDQPGDADIIVLLAEYIWLIWLAAALGLLIRKATVYQSFVRYIHAGMTPVSDMEMLDRLAIAAEEAGIQRPIELCVNPLISSPLLTGFFHGCIVLPSAELSEKDLQHIVLHELTHYKRRDMLYKWLVQTVVCLHWFNPLVHLMSREITDACEFSCDEAVVARLGCGSAQEYGQTLLNAMAAVGRYRENLGAVTLSENKKLLKERLGAIMNFKRKSAAIRLLTGALTLCVIFGAAFVGVYPAAAAERPSGKPSVSGNKNSTQAGTVTHSDRYSLLAEKYYKAGSLPLFEIVFPRLDESTQKAWLEKFYEDCDFAFFSVAARGLDEDSALLSSLAEKVYADGEIVFFSTLADWMDETELESWLDRALEDGNWVFQSVLFDRLDRDDEFDEWKEQEKKELEAAQAAEYGAVGVTIDGKDYYYQGKLVNIFLDIRSNKSFYTLNMNPKGTVNVKIIRDANNKITGAAYMTEAEVTELFGGMEDPDDTGMELIPVDFETVGAGKTVFLGEFTLSDGDTILYDVFAETGNGMKVFFAKDQQFKTVYWSVHNTRQPGEPLKCTADFTVKPPANPGTYRLYLQAPDGALGNVKGSVSICSAADAA